MADYQLTQTDIVVRALDQLHIPNDPANAHRQEYDRWLADGGVPDPYVPPEPPPPEPPTAEQQVLFDHENRIRAQEGAPPLTIGEFLVKLGVPDAHAPPTQAKPVKKRMTKKRTTKKRAKR